MSESKRLLVNYIQNLRRFSNISAQAETIFSNIACHTEQYRKSQTIVHEGAPSERFHLITKGAAYRYKTLHSGNRQILSYHMANDFIDFQAGANGRSDFGVRACEPVQTISISITDFMEISARFADLAQALWLSSLAEAAIAREWLANCGRRTSRASIIHLILEFFIRFKNLSLSDGLKFRLPFTQTEIGDAVGASTVQVNRVMQALRAEHLIRSYGSTIVIENLDALAQEADFSPHYLGLP
jgi:CRP-like cAMP-binding protein